MLLCHFLPGKASDCPGGRRMDGQPIKSGYNSHRVAKNADGYGNELVIHNSKQILPCYILHVGLLAGALPTAEASRSPCVYSCSEGGKRRMRLVNKEDCAYRLCVRVPV